MPASEFARANPDMTDSEAINAVLRGNREMFEAIVRRYNAQLYRVGIAYLRNHAQTEDAMQNTYLKAFLHLERFRGAAAFSTWLTRIMVNECLMVLRGRKDFVTLDELHRTGADREAFLAPAAEPQVNQEEVKAVIEQAIQALPRSHRAVYLLREIQHLSTADTARSLGISPANVKVSLHRAREGLKSQLIKSAAGIELFDYPAQFCDPMTARVMRLILGTSRTSPL
jgi:RNA polymerase sigma-70 factor (ECF subfamily)